MVGRLHSAASAVELGFAIDQVERSFREIEQKRATTRYLHMTPVLIEPVPGVTANDEELL
jgi:NAD+ synthase